MQAAQRQCLQQQCALSGGAGFFRGPVEGVHAGQRCGEPGDYFFCPECGTTVHYKIDAQPGLIAIPVGAFADLDFPAPFLSFYHQSRRYPWVGIGAEPLERID
jgi:hypothetical protein